MTSWLKWRLCALFGVSVCIGTATYLHAQNDYPPPAKTPKEAAINFFGLLDTIRYRQSSERYKLLPLDDFANSIKRSQAESFDQGQTREASPSVFHLLANQVGLVPYETSSQTLQQNSTIVTVAPPPKSKGREVVVVAEDGGYRVDLVATYGRWHNLSDEEAAKALYHVTGWISPTLATDIKFVGTHTLSSCQTNLAQLVRSTRYYMQDYELKLPPARRWRTVTASHVRDQSIYTCPALALKGKSNGYAYNSQLSQRSIDSLASLSEAAQFYETTNLKSNMFAPFTGRAYRHVSGGNFGMNVGFLDEHVKWYKQGTENSALKPIKLASQEDK